MDAFQEADGVESFVARSAGATTTRRMRVNITRNTKGFNYDTTVEITSSDPDLDLANEIRHMNRDVDVVARWEIRDRENADKEVTNA